MSAPLRQRPHPPLLRSHWLRPTSPGAVSHNNRLVAISDLGHSSPVTSFTYRKHTSQTLRRHAL